MVIQEALQAINEEISKLERARALLVDLVPNSARSGKRRGRPPGSKNQPKPAKLGRKPMSEATKKKLSASAKARWKKGTGIGILGKQVKPVGKAAKKSSGVATTKVSAKPLVQT